MKTEFSVDVESMESVTIADAHGEIVTWVKSEWLEDPESVPTVIANAIVMVYEEGPEALRESIGHPGERTGFDYRSVNDVIEILVPVEMFLSSEEAYDHVSKTLKASPGTLGIVSRIHVGYFEAHIPAENYPPFLIEKEFDWGDEGELFVFKERVGYGDEPNTHE